MMDIPGIFIYNQFQQSFPEPEICWKEENSLTIQKELTDGTLTVALEGRLDTTTAPELEQELKENMKYARNLVLDFGELEYISSAGLRVILMAQKTMTEKDGMKITGVNELIAEIFDVTGFTDILTIEYNTETV